MQPLVLTRPQAFRAVSAATLVTIVAWAALSPEVGGFGVLAYPAIIGLQTWREWQWRLEVGRDQLSERQGIGGTRQVRWADVEAVVMPDADWWRVNPVLKVLGAPNVQMTATDGIEDLLATARSKRIPVEGDPASISLARSLGPWVLVLGLAVVLLGIRLAAPA